ncbi:hypothetical protein ACHAXN_008213 [Cyclotella atomus]
MADAPYTDYEWDEVLPNDLEKVSRSPVPTFVLPGDNDLNDCDDHEQAEAYWSEYFGYIDKYWNHTIPLTRWGALDKSFAFIQKRVLFFGINIVGGTPYSQSEKSERHREHLCMLKSIMNDRRWDYDVVVLLGHAEPKARDTLTCSKATTV